MGRGERPFRFQPFWLSHPEFLAVVSQAWEGNEHQLPTVVAKFAVLARVWNKEVFGNIFWKKKNLMARLLGVQRIIANQPSQRMINLQNALTDELNGILAMEEELWAMKSRTNWLIQEERNTAYFHLSTLAKHSRNRIVSIKNSLGDWITEIEEVKDAFQKGFVNLYQNDQSFNFIPLSVRTFLVNKSSKEFHAKNEDTG